MDRNIIGVAVLSATAGFVIGYALGKRKNELEFDEAVAEACEENRTYFHQKRAEFEERVANEQEEAYQERIRVEAAASALATYQGVEPLEEDLPIEAPSPVPVPELEPQEYTPEFAPEAILKTSEPEPMRRPTAPKPKAKPREPYVDRSKPYVVNVEEFLQNEDWSSSTLTYYEGDDTLADEEDRIMDDRDRLVVVGTHLSDFGVESNDENAVYIKNEKMMLYIEVVKDGGKYSDKVAGLGGNE